MNFLAGDYLLDSQLSIDKGFQRPLDYRTGAKAAK